MESREAKTKLIEILQHAYSGELGAIHAYRGHWKSVSNLEEKKKIREIEQEEVAHRECIGIMLCKLSAKPISKQERLMELVGKTIAFLCQVGGWFIPMYGAGRLESKNIREYEEAAKYARIAGYTEFIDDLLTMAEIEWDHEQYFRQKANSHFLSYIFPKWEIPPEKNSIRLSYQDLQFEHRTFF